jgi:hypothetical protein
MSPVPLFDGHWSYVIWCEEYLDGVTIARDGDTQKALPLRTIVIELAIKKDNHQRSSHQIRRL